MVRYSSKDLSVTILKTMFDTKYHADVELLPGTEGKSILAHKAVLSSASEYFQVMFASSFKEAVESKVTLKDIEPNILEAIINFLYCGFIDIPDAETAIQLMKNAHLMKLPELIKHSADYLKKNITAETCLEMHLLAKQFEEDDLFNEVNQFIVTNFKSVSKQDEFEILNIDSVVDFISARNESTSEDDLAEWILDKIGKDDDREKQFKKLLYLLQIESINRKDLIDQIQAKCTEKDDVDYIIKTLNKRFFRIPNPPVPKINTNKQHVIMKEVNNPEKLSLCEYNFDTCEYQHKTYVHNYGTSIGIYDEKIVFAYKKNTILVYDFIKRTTSPPIECPSEILAVTKIDNFVYALTESEIFKFESDKSECSRLQGVSFDSNFRFVTFCKYNNELKILLYYKYNLSDILVYNYNPINEECTLETKTSITRSDKILGVVHDNALYCFIESCLHIYHLNDKTWNYKNYHDLNISGASSINGKLYLCISNKVYNYTAIIKKLILPPVYESLIPML